jgi:alkylation response protein AidB-like acyl-CoA dehydrogenase
VRGKPFIQYKAIAYKLTDIAADIKAAKCMVNCCAGHTAHDTIDSTTTSDIELVTGETAVRVSVQAIRILGGAGIMPEYPVGRFRHDALVYVIGQGTSEIERNSVARSLM